MQDPIQILNKLLKQIATEQNFVDYDVKIEPVSSGGANYTSTLYEVTITERDKQINLFAKVAAIGEKMRTQAPKMYKTENFVYTKLAKIYERLEDENQVPEEDRLVFSKFYGCNIEPYEETIVMENLFKSGFEAYDRFKSMNKEYAFSAVRELAKFHSLSLALAEHYPEEFKEIFEEIDFQWDTESEMMEGFFNNMTSKAIAMTKKEYREPLERFLKTMPIDAFRNFMTSTKRPVLAHGDYRASNLMHRNREDGKVDIKIVDLQTMQSSTPMMDLLYFIFTGSDEQFRAQYFDKLTDYYCTELQASLRRLNLDPEKVYPRKEFEEELKEKLPFGLVISIFALPIVTVDVENAPKVDKDMAITDFSETRTNDLYTERLNGIVSDYIKWGILQ